MGTPNTYSCEETSGEQPPAQIARVIANRIRKYLYSALFIRLSWRWSRASRRGTLRGLRQGRRSRCTPSTTHRGCARRRSRRSWLQWAASLQHRGGRSHLYSALFVAESWRGDRRNQGNAADPAAPTSTTAYAIHTALLLRSAEHNRRQQ
jgi:hypothetical protein